MAARILIVEDEMLVAMDLESILADSGFEPVGIAADLTTAEEYFDQSIDLALVDLNLRDGLTGPQIGKLLGARGVTVLFLTANPRTLGVVGRRSGDQHPDRWRDAHHRVDRKRRTNAPRRTRPSGLRDEIDGAKRGQPAGREFRARLAR